MILITGDLGLIGRHTSRLLQEAGWDVRGFDLKRSPHQDITDPGALRRAVEGCDGVVHLAATSRVILGERDPARCWTDNVGGTANVIAAALARDSRPWVIASSSREVYGERPILPVREDDPLEPVNIYGWSKLVVEHMVAACRGTLRASVLRFSNVYGDVGDHADRVIPAFCAAAAAGGTIRVDGGGNTFDFTHVSDVARGVVLAVSRMERDGPFPPIHLTSGRAVTLDELAAIADRAGGGRATVVDALPRSFDVSRFSGDPARARDLLGWESATPLEDGVARFVSDFAAVREVVD